MTAFGVSVRRMASARMEFAGMTDSPRSRQPDCLDSKPGCRDGQNEAGSGMVERSGFELPLLLVGAFRSLIDELHAELARQGHDLARPVHGFALQAIGPEGVTVSELGRRLGVSKQAAAKT